MYKILSGKFDAHWCLVKWRLSPIKNMLNNWADTFMNIPDIFWWALQIIRVCQRSIWRAKPSVVLQTVYLICLWLLTISNRNEILMNHAERKIQLSFYLFSILQNLILWKSDQRLYSTKKLEKTYKGILGSWIIIFFLDIVMFVLF